LKIFSPFRIFERLVLALKNSVCRDICQAVGAADFPAHNLVRLFMSA